MSMPSELLKTLKQLGVGLIVGSVCAPCAALFVATLRYATHQREAVPALIYMLPLWGAILGFLLEGRAQALSRGMGPIIHAIRGSNEPVPWALAPLSLMCTALTHVFGGSVGREGAAVQIGASVAETCARVAQQSGASRAVWVRAGVAAGFSAVFSTPVAAAIFAMEYAQQRRVATESAVTTWVAAYAANVIAQRLGVQKACWPPLKLDDADGVLLCKLLVLAVASAALAIAFVLGCRLVRRCVQTLSPRRSVQLFAGGLAAVLLWRLGQLDFALGLGDAGMHAALAQGPLPVRFVPAKLVLTAVCVGSGFVGGEVTPLFFMGAGLGHAMAPLLGLDPVSAAALCMAATLGAAARAPLALMVMAGELFGAPMLAASAVCCAVAAALVGPFGIYPNDT